MAKTVVKNTPCPLQVLHGNDILEIAPKDPQNATIMLGNQNYDVRTPYTTQFVPNITEWNITVSNGGKTATYTLILNNASDVVPVTDVSLDQTSLTLTEGGTSQLTATITPSNATNKVLTWSSSNTSAATVDGNGTVTAHKAGTATITVTTADGGHSATCAVTVSADTKPNPEPTPDPDPGDSGSGGSGSPSYTVDIDADIDHGTVTVKPSHAEKGDTVTITAKPDKGYQVGEVTVTDKNGDTIKVTDKGSGKYTFTMPGGKVSVDVTFVPEKQWTNPFADVAEDAWYERTKALLKQAGLPDLRFHDASVIIGLSRQALVPQGVALI